MVNSTKRKSVSTAAETDFLFEAISCCPLYLLFHCITQKDAASIRAIFNYQ